MVTRTIQVTRRGPGRPKTRDTEVITLNLDRKALAILRELSQKHGMPMNQTLETLLFSAANDDYPLKLSEDNNHLREQLRTCEKMVREVESQLERLKLTYDSEDRELRGLRELKIKIDRIIERQGELKLFELVMKAYNLQPGERLQYMTKRFIEEFFVDSGNELISRELGIVIIKNHQVGHMGWIVRKLEDR